MDYRRSRLFKKEYYVKSTKEISRHLNRSVSSIENKAKKLNVYVYQRTPSKRWSKWEEEFLEINYAKLSAKSIAKKINRTVSAVRRKAESMNISIYDEYIGICHLSRVFKIDKSTIKNWISRYGLPCKTHKRANVVYYDIDPIKFWDWAYEHIGLIPWDRYERNELVNEPCWVNEVIGNFSKPVNHRKAMTHKEKQKIYSTVLKGTSIETAAEIFGRTPLAIRHIYREVLLNEY